MPKLDFDETVEALNDRTYSSDFLATDSSPRTFERQLKEQTGHEFTPELGAALRAMYYTTDELEKYFRAIIVHDSIFDQTTPDGVPLQEQIENKGMIVVGKKCGVDPDTGLIPAEQMRALSEEMEKLRQLGVCVVKIRWDIECLTRDRYAEGVINQAEEAQSIAADMGDMAFVHEPEFNIKNPGSLKDNSDLMVRVLGGIVKRFRLKGLDKHPWFLKTSFPTPGKEYLKLNNEQINPEESAEEFQRVARDAELPEDMLTVFLSGGLTNEDARLLLETTILRDQMQRHLASSFSRTNLRIPHKRAMQPDGTVDFDAGHEAMQVEGLKMYAANHGLYTPELERRRSSKNLKKLLGLS